MERVKIDDLVVLGTAVPDEISDNRKNGMRRWLFSNPWTDSYLPCATMGTNE